MNESWEPGMDDLERARDAVRRLPVRGPSAEFRACLARDFASRSIAHRDRGGRLRRWRWGLAPLGAVAAAAALWLVLAPQPESPFVLVAVAGGGGVRHGDAELGGEDLRGARFQPGERVRTGESVAIDLVQGSLFALELSEGCDLDLPCDAGNGCYRAVVREGTATWVTGPAFPGRELRVVAPDAEVVATGTTFAVRADGEKTCVSVLAGEVGVVTRDGARQSVEAGRCRQFYRCGSPATEAELDPEQAANLTAWHERSRGLLPPDSRSR